MNQKTKENLKVVAGGAVVGATAAYAIKNRKELLEQLKTLKNIFQPKMIRNNLVESPIEFEETPWEEITEENRSYISLTEDYKKRK